MSLGIALDELRSTGWAGLDSSGCGFDAGGRAYPGVARVTQEFAQAGFEFAITRIDAFNCYRAHWREAGASEERGSVVSLSEQEAAVFALAQMRRGLVAVSA